jgi:hypothetical protein
MLPLQRDTVLLLGSLTPGATLRGRRGPTVLVSTAFSIAWMVIRAPDVNLHPSSSLVTSYRHAG